MQIQIGHRWIGEKHPVFIIAEAGLNHQGSIDIARELITAAAAAGADAIKFQKRCVDTILTRAQLNAPYLTKNSFGKTYGEHRRALEFDWEAYQILQAHARQQKILFFASVWDVPSINFMHGLGVPAFKIASADMTNLPLLKHVAQQGKPLILSTGMSTTAEIDLAVATVRKHTESFILLQCTSGYPVPADQIDLRVMPQFKERYRCIVGYSGHELGIAPSCAAVALGAAVIERHFTLDRTMKGSDQFASLEPPLFRQMVEYIRDIEQALGQPRKRIYPIELPNRRKLAKSIVSAMPITAGETIQPHMVTVKGPGTGISPIHLEELASKNWMAARDIPADTILQVKDLLPVMPQTARPLTEVVQVGSS